MGKRSKCNDSGDESDGSEPDMSKPRKLVNNTELTSQHALLATIADNQNAPQANANGVPAEVAGLLHAALFGDYGQTGAANAGQLEPLHAHLMNQRMADELYFRRMGMFHNLPRNQYVAARVPRCHCMLTCSCVRERRTGTTRAWPRSSWFTTPSRACPHSASTRWIRRRTLRTANSCATSNGAPATGG